MMFESRESTRRFFFEVWSKATSGEALAGMERIVAIAFDGTQTVEMARLDLLERFAEIVAAAEREECAKQAENMDAAVLAMLNITRQPIAIAAAIRARGGKA